MGKKDTTITYKCDFLNSYGKKVDISEAVIVDAHILKKDEKKNVLDYNIMYDKRYEIMLLSRTNIKPSFSVEEIVKNIEDTCVAYGDKDKVLEFADKLEELGKYIKEVCKNEM